MKEKMIRFRYIYLSLFAGMLFGIGSCCRDSEDIIVQHFDLPTYNEILLEAVFDVEILEDETYSLQIRGEKAEIEDLTYEVQNQLLIIKNRNAFLWTHPKTDPPKLIISGKGLTRIEAKETCTIKSLNTITTETFGILLGGKLNIADLMLDCKNFYYWNTSPVGGKLTLKGKSDNVSIYNGALMEVDANQLPCDLATVENGSKSDVRVFVKKKLDYSISGTGNIYLSGNPDEIVPGLLSSTGRLIH